MCVCASFMCLVPPEVRRGHIRRKLWKYQVEAGQMAQQPCIEFPLNMCNNIWSHLKPTEVPTSQRQIL
ncbi:mCG1031907, isoform CRA_a [Mus musculus]|nr:mCG1031907, isoform CRA_a [Mus musculus]EDL23873.1 mCG1031907, isoform CRA_a [Mus musculus]